jgi:hypothetical protein
LPKESACHVRFSGQIEAGISKTGCSANASIQLRLDKLFSRKFLLTKPAWRNWQTR